MKANQVRAGELLRLAALAVLPPVTSVYLMQFILGALPWEMTPGAVLANALCTGAVYFLLWAVTGHPAVCCVLLHLACGCGERPTTSSPSTGARRCSPGT